jgi:hypothetical protein
MRRHSVRFALLLAMLMVGSVSTCYGEQILKKGSRKILGNRVENGDKFRSCRGKLLDVGDGQVEDTNIKCGCSTCPPILGNRDKWDSLFKITRLSPKPSKQRAVTSQLDRTDSHHQPAQRASVLLRNPPLKEVTLGYVGKREGNKFRTCDGDVMEIKESDRIEETDITCDTDIKKIRPQLLDDKSRLEMSSDMREVKRRQYLGIRISKQLFLTCDNSIFELNERSRLTDTDLACDCDSCDAPEKPTQKEKPDKPKPER